MAKEKQRRLPHIFLQRGHGEREKFTSPQRGGSRTCPQRDRKKHARRLEKMLTAAVSAAEEQIKNRDPDICGGAPGFYLEFSLLRSQRSVLDQLENRQGKEPIELVTAQPLAGGSNLMSATVFVPEYRRDYFLRKVRDYREKDDKRYEKDSEGKPVLDEGGDRKVKSCRPKNENLVASLEMARIAEAKSLFSDRRQLFPKSGEEVWWEVWLRPNKRCILEKVARKLELEIKAHSIVFREREVVLVRAAPEVLGQIISHSDAIAELRIASNSPSVFMEMDREQQIARSQELADRVVAPSVDAPAGCLLDSGTTRRHPLIKPALAKVDQLAWHPDWNTEDVSTRWSGHGTQMSGIALYGDLIDVLVANGPVKLTHRLESVKILPDDNKNDPRLYGNITATAVGRIEVQSPHRSRVYCLAVTHEKNGEEKNSDEDEDDFWDGRPSSWSARVDDIAYGNGEAQRLIMISAGNIRKNYPAKEYLCQNDLRSIESPAQAWNALTVGAITEKVTLTDPNYRDWSAVAKAGDLSPRSRTSVIWKREWPIKPDVVFEGGNLGEDPQTGTIDHVDELALLTTYRRPEERAFDVTGDTSAATAQVARMGAQILSDRPELWPETVRALIVHSAEWTPAMVAHLSGIQKKSDRWIILRRYGYGVPSLERATHSLSRDVTLVVESELQPFHRPPNGRAGTCDMMLHDLPWPKDKLNDLGEKRVEMRTTLSYFVEPNPGERGWTKRHSYCGHGLRFSVKRPEESLDRFRRRVNRAARDNDEHVASGTNDDGWVLGPKLRDRGSLHSDVWQGTATDLADRHAIGIFPVGGWWREKPNLGRTDRRVRYALITTLRTEVEVDLYTAIANAIGVEKEVET